MQGGRRSYHGGATGGGGMSNGRYNNRAPYDRSHASGRSYREHSGSAQRTRTVKEALETSHLLSKEQYLAMGDVNLDEETDEMKNQAYKTYKEKHRRLALERFFIAHKEDSWIAERYLGDEFENESSNYRKSLEAFIEEFNAGSLSELKLEFSPEMFAAQEELGFIKNVPLSAKFPEAIAGAAIERFGDVLTIGNVPPTVRRSSLESLLRDVDEGFERLFLGEPVPDKNFYRSGFATFKESTDLGALVLKLENVLVEGSKIYYSVMKSFTKQVKIISSTFSSAERVEKDLGQSTKLLQSLITRFDLNAELPWLADEDKLKALDLNIACLRRVFSLCYYTGAKCCDALELQKLYGDLVLRAPEGEENVDAQSMSALDVKLEDLLRLYGEPFESATEDNIVESKYVVKLEEARFRCTICSKLFKGPEFVIKHVRSKHEEESNGVIQQLHVMNLFLSRPSPCAFLRSPLPRRSSVPHVQPYRPPRPQERPPPPDADTRPARRPMRSYNDWDAPAAGEVEINYD